MRAAVDWVRQAVAEVVWGYTETMADEDLKFLDRLPERLHVLAMALHERAFDAHDTNIEYGYFSCPYFQNGGLCSMGCREEPECVTCCPIAGWPESPSRLRDLVPTRASFRWGFETVAERKRLEAR